MTTEELIKLNRRPLNEEVGCLICGKECAGFTYCVECGVDSFVEGKSGIEFLKEKDSLRADLLIHYAHSDTTFSPKNKSGRR